MLQHRFLLLPLMLSITCVPAAENNNILVATYAFSMSLLWYQINAGVIISNDSGGSINDKNKNKGSCNGMTEDGRAGESGPDECHPGDRSESSTAAESDVAHQEFEVGDDFFAWSASRTKILRAMFPDLRALQSAWEVHPLLSKVSFAHGHHDCADEHGSEDIPTTSSPSAAKTASAIPTIIHNRSSVTQLLNEQSEPQRDPLISLFSVTNTSTIIEQQQGTLVNIKDYKLVKKITMPGATADEEWMGMIPGNNVQHSLEQILYKFNVGGFSFILHKMHQRWKDVANMARILENELECMHVGCNLYLTPEAVTWKDARRVGRKAGGNQGFEYHWDWMDVIVIQLSGKKRWSVAREPTIFLSNKDQKRRPTNGEIRHYIHATSSHDTINTSNSKSNDNSNIGRFAEFTMCPGDILYIPRGYIHNASTTVLDPSIHSGELDECASSSSILSESLSQMEEKLSTLADGPSLHLTFGLEHGCESTLESLLHHALQAYFANNNGYHIGYGNDIVIPARTCPNPDQYATIHDINWKSVLHHSLAEVARREHDCDYPSYRGVIVMPTADASTAVDGYNGANGHAYDVNGSTKSRPKCNGTAILRKSVPFIPQNYNDSSSEHMQQHQQLRRYPKLKQYYLQALDIFASKSDLSKTAKFIESKLLRPPDDSELIFCFPGYRDEDVIFCPDALLMLSMRKLRQYARLLNEFIAFAKENFDEAWRLMNVRRTEIRRKDWMRQDSELDRVGQGRL